MKKILSIIFSALLICSATACSAGNDSFVSVIDSNSNSSYFDDASSDENVSVDTDSSSDIDIENLPSKVDLRNYNGKNYVTPVKSQAFGDCWSFDISAAAESSYSSGGILRKHSRKTIAFSHSESKLFQIKTY